MKSAEPKQIIGLFPELLGIGGVQEAGRLTAAAIQRIATRRDWSVDFLSLNDAESANSFVLEGVSVRFRGYGRAKVPFVVNALRRARSLSLGTTHFVLAAHPNLALPASLMRLNRSRLKTGVISHGIEVWEPLPYFRRRALVGADIALAPSADTMRRLIEVQGVSPQKVRRLAWPINPAFLRMADTPAELPCPALFSQRPVILTVGRWSASERYKGADELIGAVAQLSVEFPNVTLVAVGGGNDIPRLRKLAGTSGVSERVHFLENLSREEIAACYAHADVFALPSSGEGFGIVFLEAMAFAKPVIAAACGGATDVVEDGVNGLLVPPRHTEQLATALRRLLGDAALRERFGARGRQIVTEKYSFEVFESQLAEILTGD
jgi:phosphatidyl-myo-inositol dimannoside synthase